MTTLSSRSSVRFGALVFSAASLAANAQGTCTPGAAFGITAYQCANCGASTMRDSTRTIYTFGAEPVVLEAREGNRIRPGDVIVAINGNPITTRAGADQFAYPPLGEQQVTIRRNGVNMEVEQIVNARLCMATGGIMSAAAQGGSVRGDSVLRGMITAGRGGAMGGGGTGGAGGRGGARAGAMGGGGVSASIAPRSPVLSDSATRALFGRVSCDFSARAGVAYGATRTDTIRARANALDCAADSMRAATLKRSDTVRAGRGSAQLVGSSIITMPETQTSLVELRNFGLVLSCRPSCTRARSRDGAPYWKFDGYPAVDVTPATKDGLAAKAGLREGDVVISVNGLSPLTEEGALLLNRADRELTLNMEVSRAGKREHVTLKL